MQSLTDILTVLIGLVFVYLVLSMIVSYMVEVIATYLEKRQVFLANAIQLMLDPSATELATIDQIIEKTKAVSGAIDLSFVEKILAWLGAHLPFRGKGSADTPVHDLIVYFYRHPLIKSLSEPGSLPTYISAQAFSNVILDKLHEEGDKLFKANLNIPEALKQLSLEQLHDLLPPELRDLSLEKLRAMEPDKLRSMLTQELQSLDVETLYKIISTDYVDLLEAGLKQLSESSPEVFKALQPYFAQARLLQNTTEARLTAVVENISTWFKSTMDRTTGWYTRYTKYVALVIAFILAVAINADTVEIFQSLYNNASLRQMVSDVAVEYVKDHPQMAQAAAGANASPTAVAGVSTNQSQGITTGPGAAPGPSFTDVLNQVRDYQNAIPLPMGWSNFLAATYKTRLTVSSLTLIWLIKISGLLATTLAISQGSSIWFQLLSKLINLRNTGLKPGENATADTGLDASAQDRRRKTSSKG